MNSTWISNSKTRHYNGGYTDIDSDSMPSTLSLVEDYDSFDDSDEEIYEISAEVERIVMGY